MQNRLGISMTIAATKRSSLVLLLVALLATVGCEAPVDYQGENSTYFTINGFLDTRADTQFVRITPVRATPDAPVPESLDARVTTTRRNTFYDQKKTVVWKDSLVRLDDGSPGHLFYAPLHVIPGVRYHLSVQRSDGAATRATIRVPPPRLLQTIVPTETEGATITWVNLGHRPYRMQACYRVARTQAASPRVVRRDYSGAGSRSDLGWRVSLNLADDRSDVLDALGAPSESTILLYELGLTVTERSENWRSHDPDQDIEHGLGFFGAVTRSYGVIALSRRTIRFYNYQHVARDTLVSCTTKKR